MKTTVRSFAFCCQEQYQYLLLDFCHLKWEGNFYFLLENKANTCLQKTALKQGDKVTEQKTSL